MPHVCELRHQTICSFVAVLALLRRLRPQYQAYIESFDNDDVAKRRQLHQEVLRGVLLCREFGDEKLQLASHMQELVSGDSCFLFLVVLRVQCACSSTCSG